MGRGIHLFTQRKKVKLKFSKHKIDNKSVSGMKGKKGCRKVGEILIGLVTHYFDRDKCCLNLITKLEITKLIKMLGF